MGWNSTGSKLASGSLDHSVRTWTLEETGRGTEAELRGHQASVEQVRWDPNQPDTLASAAIDKTVRVWDARMNKCASIIETRGENLNMRWHPESTYLVVGDHEDYMSFVDMRQRKCVKQVKFPGTVNDIAWEPTTGQMLFVTTGDLPSS